MAKSYYAILEVPPGAAPEEIRAAYRRLVKAYHPDHYDGGSDAFRDIQEAYGVLGDDERRSRYEQQRREASVAPQPPRRPPGPPPEPLIPGDAQPLRRVSPGRRPVNTQRMPMDDLFEWLWRNFV